MANRNSLSSMKGEPAAEPEADPRSIDEEELQGDVDRLRWKLDIAIESADHHEETRETIRETFNDRWATATTEWKHSKAGQAFLKSWRVGHDKATKDHEAAQRKQAKLETQLHAAKLKLMRLQEK